MRNLSALLESSLGRNPLSDCKSDIEEDCAGLMERFPLELDTKLQPRSLQRLQWSCDSQEPTFLLLRLLTECNTHVAVPCRRRGGRYDQRNAFARRLLQVLNSQPRCTFEKFSKIEFRCARLKVSQLESARNADVKWENQRDSSSSASACMAPPAGQLDPLS